MSTSYGSSAAFNQSYNFKSLCMNRSALAEPGKHDKFIDGVPSSSSLTVKNIFSLSFLVAVEDNDPPIAVETLSAVLSGLIRLAPGDKLVFSTMIRLRET